MRETDSIRTIRGVGEKTEKLFEKLGIRTVGDLLAAYPRDYDIYQEPVPVEKLADGCRAAFLGTVLTPVEVARVRNLTIVSCTAGDGTGKCRLTWYNMPYLRSSLKRGMVLYFRGRVKQKGRQTAMEQPEILTPAAYEQKLHSMQPVYALTAGLTNHMVQKTVRAALDDLTGGRDYLPEDVRLEHGLAEYHFAVCGIHFPRDMESFRTARRRLVFDEFLLFILALQGLRERGETLENRYPMKRVWWTEETIESLPYRLTGAQERVWHEIERDLGGGRLMARLIQGDVGSGKTILAFLAMIMAAGNGYQSAVMAPTEVLARQHFEALTRLLEQNHLLESCHPVLLTGSMRASQKKEAYAAIASGRARMVVGTHALIQEKVEYPELGLVITDEQHRFGVRQRDAFAGKGGAPHTLVMSATPIPRTLGIILYGDLDISVVDERPVNRLPIKNCVVDAAWRPKAYRFIERQVGEGRQAYVVCPMVDAGETMDGENVTEYTQKLREALPAGVRVEMLHGQMPSAEKNRVMEAFAGHEIDVLVSTTVIEVGVNVPNATVMMIENAERFGLAQLHQLRGRVGRGGEQSYCIFVCGNQNAEKNRRLEILSSTNDGFRIAEEDLKLRGPGDLFGIRQSGFLAFGLADIYQDAAILQEAAVAAGGILKLDPELSLPQNAALRARLDRYLARQGAGPGL